MRLRRKREINDVYASAVYPDRQEWKWNSVTARSWGYILVEGSDRCLGNVPFPVVRFFINVARVAVKLDKN